MAREDFDRFYQRDAGTVTLIQKSSSSFLVVYFSLTLLMKIGWLATLDDQTFGRLQYV